ncbi:MAG TPA: fibronectin type III domain-containing protein [Candidatus Pacearchaeota archaeon]|nr:fibronectin type III domain-containing protein [Candidatus Pacearchaeota archaeon]
MKDKKIGIFLAGAIAIFAPIFFIFADSVSTSVDVFVVPAPNQITATVISSTQINLSWDSVAQAVSYKIYKNSSYIGSSTTTSYSDTGLLALTAYTYQVASVDSDGNESALSSEVTATTQASPSTGTSQSGSVGGQYAVYVSQPSSQKPIIINKDEKISDSKQVILYFSARNAEQMMISNDSNFTGANWEEYKTMKMWTIQGSGSQKVYAKFKNSNGAVSNVFMDMIFVSGTGLDQEKIQDAINSLDKLKQDVLDIQKNQIPSKEQIFIQQNLQEKQDSQNKFEQEIKEEEEELNLIQEAPKDTVVGNEIEIKDQSGFKAYIPLFAVVMLLFLLLFFIIKR